MDYYKNHYRNAQRTGLQGWGNSLVDRQIEAVCRRNTDAQILEIGASSGEHFQFVDQNIHIKSYTAFDLSPRITDPSLAHSLESQGLVQFVSGDAAAMPFPDRTFDVSISTCVLAHVRNPERTFEELRRVTKFGGCVVVGMPCDPGLLNRLVKSTVTYRSMKRAGVDHPRLSYAREHINPVGNLIEISKFVFREDEVFFSYFPFHIPSWNMNLVVTLRAVIQDSN